MTKRPTEPAAQRSSLRRGRWRWSNVPVPESYVAAIVAGAVLHRIKPARLFSKPKVAVAMGIPCLLTGAMLAAWAVCAAGEVDTSEPDKIVMGGPYAITRNPMYLAWPLIATGFGLFANSVWMLLLLPAAVAFTHLAVIPREERYLERRFDRVYLGYRSRVPRWLWPLRIARTSLSSP